MSQSFPVEVGLLNLTVGSDLRRMRLQLLDLGFDVPTRSYGFGDANGSPAGEVGATKTSATRDTPGMPFICDCGLNVFVPLVLTFHEQYTRTSLLPHRRRNGSATTTTL